MERLGRGRGRPGVLDANPSIPDASIDVFGAVKRNKNAVVNWRTLFSNLACLLGGISFTSQDQTSLSLRVWCGQRRLSALDAAVQVPDT